MNIKNTAKNYGFIAIAFHWASALIAVAMFASGIWMTSLTYDSGWYHAAPGYHKAFGLLFAALILARLAWKGLNQSPDEIGKPWEISASKFVHGVLYLLLVALFVSGYLITTGGGGSVDVLGLFNVPSVIRIGQYTELAEEIHSFCAFSLAFLTLVHAGAAIKHHVIDKDRVLIRMFGR